MKEDYQSSAKALDRSGLDSLVDRTEHLCQKFSRVAFQNTNIKDMFPHNSDCPIEIRAREPHKVTFARTDRLKKSAIPYMLADSKCFSPDRIIISLLSLYAEALEC